MFTLIIIGIVFVTVAMTAVIALMCLAIRREESARSLHRQAPTWYAAMTRRVLGWHQAGTPARRTARRRRTRSGTPTRRAHASALSGQ